MQLTILDFTIDREDELKKLTSNMRNNIPTLLLGKPGTGKTHLLYRLMEYLKARKIPYAYIEKFKPVKETLITLCCTLTKIKLTDENLKAIKRQTVSELAQKITFLLQQRKKPIIIIFDHLEELTSSTADILEKLSSLTVVFGAGQFIRKVRSLRRFFWQFDIIDVNPLSKEDSSRLTEKLIQQNKLNIKCKSFFINQVVSNTSGIPLSIIETINRARTKGTITKNYVRNDMFIHGSGLKEVDASPFVILIFAFFIVMRFVYRGFGEYQGYALFGALTGIGVFVRYMLYRQMRRRQE